MPITLNAEFIRKRMDELHLNRQITAATIGVSVANFWDLISYPDEVSALEVVHVIRLCLILRASPADVVSVEHAPRAKAFGGLATLLNPATVDPGITANWEEASIRQSLQSEWHLLNMPLTALSDICDSSGYSATDVLSACLAGLAAPT